MSRLRPVLRSFSTLSAIALFCGTVAAAQESVQKLMERGALQEAVDRAGAEGGNQESIYLAAQALSKMDNNGGAEERYSRLREDGNDAWKAIGESGAKLIAGDLNGAMDAANGAVAADDGNPYAHYQLGMVAFKQGSFQRAVQAFDRCLRSKAISRTRTTTAECPRSD